MMILRSVAGVMMIGLALGATAAHAAEETCLTRSQMADMVMTAMPSALDQVRQQCASALAPNSPLRDPAGPLTVAYQAAAKDAWPRAKDALLSASAGKASPQERKQIASALTPAFVGTLMAPFIAKMLTPDACPVVDRVMTLLAPLPPANFAQLVGLLAEQGQKRDTAGNSPLHLCKE